ncbi:protein VACUOLELESS GAMETOPHYTES-like [Actinidia eriantha]|uniref:protein VACUOLELESS GAMETOPHYTES-like n=1 Tax=Actinidia eriantha TaxID=165200 RepID=UPI0025838DDE|nr:protein VACUOLELESS GAMETOPHYTES-like [Actinidia eriantha]
MPKTNAGLGGPPDCDYRLRWSHLVTTTTHRSKQLSHCSHRQPLHVSEVQEKDNIICSGCELDLFGPAYTCTKPTCDFVLHNSCLDLPQRIRHRSHPKHPLSLLSSSPYNNSEFTCDACGDSGYGFTFHCSTYNFNLHVGCASLPETKEGSRSYAYSLLFLPRGRSTGVNLDL